ncbi:Ig-like domain-containing protein [Motilimonas cestriensis]|uniref:Ig-like domain-containing protein n=1 Tax=Motilimonas cestriensis TaxID=2742685 RepID=A0ABS8W7N2_9GAMM|nr:Ig-like domain-containing protein [Motilimonas cestriensis]MCE2594991.1 Ig-like domain-containing protein [Motilimonas cestriensis]
MMCWRKLAILTSAILLSACGGGGSTDLSGGGSDGGTTTPTAAPSITPTPEPKPYTLSLDIFDCNDVAGGWDTTKRDPSECKATTSVTTAKPAVLYVKVTDSTGANVANHVVSGNATLGELKPDAKTALTDASGVAILNLQAGSVSGAGTVTISTISNESVSSQVSQGFQISVGDIATDAPVTLDLKLLNCPNDWDRIARDANLCTEVTEVKSSAPGILHVTASQGNSPVANRLFSAATTLGEIAPALTALTNANGVGILDLNAGNSDGAGRATVSIDVNGEITASSIDYAIAIDGITSEQNVSVDLKILDCLANWDRTTRDASQCSETTDVSTGNPVVLYVSLKQGNVPLASQVIAGTATLGIIKPEQSKTALTDGNGIALLDLYAGDKDGAGIVTITTQALESAASAKKGFNVGVSNIELTLKSSLAAGEEAQQNATVLITAEVREEGGALFTTPVQINFSSRCASSNEADIDASAFTVNGIATATYKPTACVNQDVITAEAPANNLIQDINIDIAATQAQSIRFESASPEFIALKGTGGAGRQETSEVRFKLVDANGNPARQQDVMFSLETAPSGTIFSPATAKTNNEGIATTVVESGTVNGVVRVKANYDIKDGSGNVIKTISSVSDQLTVSTGLPDQASFSLAFSKLILDGLSFDGNTSEVTVRLGDHFNNGVPDGTAVSFVTEGGRINNGGQGSCTTTDSTCSVTLTTQNPRPMGNRLNSGAACASSPYYTFAPCINPGGMGQPYGGRITVTAFAVGEETFFDNKPSNGQFDDGETFHDLHEVVYDYNEDGLFQQIEVPKRAHNPDNVVDDATYNAQVSTYKSATISPVTGEDDNETWHEFDQQDIGDRPSVGNNLYNGTLCSEANEAANICSRNFVEVSQSSTVIFSDNVYYIRVQKWDEDLAAPDWVDTDEIDLCKPVAVTVPPTAECSNGQRSVKVRFWLADIYNNPPVSGLTVSLEADNGLLSGITEVQTPDTVPSIYGVSPFMVPIVMTPEKDPNNAKEGTVTISLESRGFTSSASIKVKDAG